MRMVKEATNKAAGRSRKQQVKSLNLNALNEIKKVQQPLTIESPVDSLQSHRTNLASARTHHQPTKSKFVTSSHSRRLTSN